MAILPVSKQVQHLLELESAYIAGGYDPVPAFITKAKGAKIWDVDGKEYIDFTCMLGVVNQGHSHPRILEAVTKQLQDAALINCAAHTAIWPKFARMMCQRFGYDKMVSTTTGTEAVEAACKIARKWGIQVKGIPPANLLVLGVSGCFHGLSTAMWALQDPGAQRQAYGIDDPHHTNRNPNNGQTLTYGDIPSMTVCIKQNYGRIAAVVLECIRGHLRTLEEEIAYAAAVYDLCKQHNILFIADEVRMGCGKTGRFFSCDYLGEHRQPDLLAVGKSITGGIYPASFLLGRADCLDLVGVKEVVSAYSFSPVAAIATTAALAVIDDENLLENAKHIEELFLHKAKTWAKHQFISHVIARGADLGVWLKDIDQETCRLICEICMHRGLLVFPGQLRIRMGVAMVISDDDLLRGLTILSGVFDTISMHAASMRTPKV